MNDVIKIHDLPAIGRYAKSIQQSSKEVEAAASETERQFNSKTGNGNDEALALVAFFERLNILQNLVFHRYPKYMENFASSVSHFESSVSRAGFNKEAWTSGSGMQDLVKKLTDEGSDSQLYAIKDTIKHLQELFDRATSALGIENESLEATKQAAEGGLASSKDSRQKTHNQIQTSHDTFNATLFEVMSDLMGMSKDIEEAEAKLAVAPDVVLASIVNKTLTSDKAYYLDAVQTKADAEIMTVILSEGDDKKEFFTKLANVKTKDSSLEVSQIIVERLMYEVNHPKDDGSIPNLSIFMEALTQRDKESVKDYSLRLSSAAEATGGAYKVQVGDLMPEFPPPGSPKEAYDEYFKKKNSDEVRKGVTSLNNKVEWYEKLNSLFMYTAINEMGVGDTRNYQEPRPNGGYETKGYTSKNSFEKDSFKLTRGKDGKGFSFSVISNFPGSTKVQADIIDEKTDLNIQKNIDKIKDLNLEKTMLFPKTVANTMKDLAKLYAPAGVLIGIVETGMSEDKDIKKLIDSGETVSSSKIWNDTPVDKYTSKAEGALNISKNIYDYFDKKEKYDKEIKNLKNDSEAEFWQYGGTSFKQGGAKSNSQYVSPSFDVEAYLKQRDLEKNGLRTYIAETAVKNGKDPYEALEKFSSRIDNSKLSGAYDAEMKALLSGEGKRDYRLEVIGFDKLYNGLKDAELPINGESKDGKSAYENNSSIFTRDSYRTWSYLDYVTGVGQGGS